MKKVKMEIIGLSFSQLQSGAYALILGEADGKKRLPIIIGSFEAQAIAIGQQDIKPARPLTHDLFKSFAEVFGVALTEVFINKFIDGVFHAILVCHDGKQTIEIDSRTSDAVALALRFHCPIYTTEAILDAAGILIEEKQDGEEDELNIDLSEENEYAAFTDEELEQMMQEAIESEDYEKASQLRDELKRRQ
jgi:hypothetical protein